MSTEDILRNRDTDGDGLNDFIDPMPTIADDKYQYKKLSEKEYKSLNPEYAKNCRQDNDGNYILRAKAEDMAKVDAILENLTPPTIYRN